jgi:hypothetical protein
VKLGHALDRANDGLWEEPNQRWDHSLELHVTHCEVLRPIELFNEIVAGGAVPIAFKKVGISFAEAAILKRFDRGSGLHQLGDHEPLTAFMANLFKVREDAFASGWVADLGHAAVGAEGIAPTVLSRVHCSGNLSLSGLP